MYYVAAALAFSSVAIDYFDEGSLNVPLLLAGVFIGSFPLWGKRGRR